MNSNNSIIVGSEAMSVPSDSVQLSFGSEESAHKISLCIDGVEKHFWLNADNRPFLILGRSKKCDIVLPHSEVSSRHACLQLIGNHVYCVDLASGNGTFWGKSPRRSGWLRPEHPIAIRPFSISCMPADDGKLDDVELPEVDLLSSEDFGRLPCYAELTFLNSRRADGESNRLEVLQPITLIGNSPRCKLQLDHPNVSRVHCSLIVTPAGLWIIDLLSHKGTYVNGKRVHSRLLCQSDEICIGSFQFVVNYREFSEKNFYGISQPQRTAQHKQISQQNHRGNSGFSEEFVLSLVDRFAAMQQQMSEMNHQQMMVMTQLLGTMHQNYHDLAQQELARIHRINEQILQIQQRLTEVDVSLEPASTSEDQTVAPEVETHHRLLPVPFGGESPDPTTEKEVSQDVETVPIPGTTPEVIQETPILPESEQSQTASAGACEGVGVEAPLPCDKKGVDNANQQTEESNTDEELKTVEELETDKELETNHTLGNDAEVPTENPGKKRSATRDVDSHGYLIERLALLERERNSRWRKVMRLLTGTGP